MFSLITLSNKIWKRCVSLLFNVIDCPPAGNRKRHTCVTCSSVTCPGWGGGVPQSWLRGEPIPGQGVPQSWPRGYPSLGWGIPQSRGYPCSGILPVKGPGTSPFWGIQVTWIVTVSGNLSGKYRGPVIGVPPEGTWDQSLWYPPPRRDMGPMVGNNIRWRRGTPNVNRQTPVKT